MKMKSVQCNHHVYPIVLHASQETAAFSTVVILPQMLSQTLSHGHSAPDLSPFPLLENVAMGSPLWKNHTIKSRTRVWEN